MDAELADVRRDVAKVEQWGRRLDDDIVRAYEAGASLRDLREASGRSIETVRQLLRRRGVRLRPPHATDRARRSDP